LEVGGAVEPGDDALAVRVDLRNTGPQPVSSLTVTGELFGRRDEERLVQEIPPGGTGKVVLRFPDEVPRPGVHAVLLRLDYAEGTVADTSGNVTTASEPAYLLLALGENTKPAVHVSASAVTIDARGFLPVTLESADGAPHRVRLRAHTARGLIPEIPPEVDVPATGPARVEIAVRRSGALRGSHPGLWLVAEALDGSSARTSVAAADVTIAGEPGVLPRLRPFLFVLGGVLVVAALLWEFRRPALAPGA
jgi:hypothetical protein